MFVARWQVKAKFGHQSDVLKLLREWDDAVGKQVGMPAKHRYLTGHVGNAEALIVSEVELGSLGELDEMFAKLAKVDIHADWGRKMSEYVVSGSSSWEVLRLRD